MVDCIPKRYNNNIQNCPLPVAAQAQAHAQMAVEVSLLLQVPCGRQHHWHEVGCMVDYNKDHHNNTIFVCPSTPVRR